MAFAPVFGRTFPATFDRRAAVTGNGLLNNLIAYWPLSEAGGANNALDLHANALTLTQVSSPGADTGLVYGTARTFSYKGFSRADTALLSGGNADITLAAWYYRTAFAGSWTVLGKWDADATAKHEYRILENAWQVSANGSTYTSAVGVGGTEPNVWYLVIGWHDAVAETVGVQINNSSVVTAAHTGGIYDNNAAFNVAYNGGNNWYIGRIGPAAFWKSAPGGGGVLSSSQRSALWNAGNGLAYANFTT